ncbi:MAG: hypothetical protein BMS9Abin21_004 [Thermodesulfovibrionia bacterium]|nr:MAG: hypothetical protein BMS9Abin21_004 [Thermodesulfovibrionia bacterium]
MEILFNIIMLLLLVYVLMPLFKEPYWPFLKRGLLSELHSAKKEGLMAISDLDAEYEMGKLTKDDYVSLRNSLKSEIAPVLKKETEIAEHEVAALSEQPVNSRTENLFREVIRICGINR